MTSKKTTRKRGGQPRNLNAYKHGFYSEKFAKGEVDDLDAYVLEGLTEEISVMRVFIRRVISLAKGERNIDNAINNLSALGLASTRLAAMLKTQKILGGDQDKVAEALSNALTEVLKDW